jgi:uncharacterized membrane protein YgcG
MRSSLIAGLLLLTTAAPAAAAPPAPSWTCQAHVAVANLGGSSGLTLDPLRANAKPDARCQDDGAAVPAVSAKDILGDGTVTALSGNAQAETGITNASGATYTQAPAAAAQITNSNVNIGGASGLTITAKAVRSYVSGTCVNGTPVLSSPAGPDGGEVVDLRINGTPVPTEGQPDAALTQVFDGLSPLAPVVRVVLNQTYKETGPGGETIFRREAVRVEALSAAGATPLATVVLAAARVGFVGDVCKAPAGVTPPGSADQPPVTPPGLISGGNEPGSGGGGTGGGGSGTSGGGGSGSGRGNNGTNASECARLKMFFDTRAHKRGHYRSGPKKLTSRSGVRVVVRGVIRNCKGQAIVHGRIDVIHLVGKHRLVKTGLRSRGQGRLTLILPNNLTTRRLLFRYRPFLSGTAVASQQVLRIKVVRGRHHHRHH